MSGLYIGSVAAAAIGGFLVGRAASRPDSSPATNAAASATGADTAAAAVPNRGPVGPSDLVPAAAAATAAAAASSPPPAHAGMLTPTPPEQPALSLTRQRTEELKDIKEEIAKPKPRGRLVVVSYQLPVKLIKVERKADAAGAADDKKQARTTAAAPRPLAALSSGKVKFNPADIDIGEDSDNEDNKAAKKQQQKSGRGGFPASTPGGLHAKKPSIGGAAREARYTVQWDDARNFLSNLRVMQAQHASNANAANAAAIAEGKAQSYYPSDVQWVGVPNVQTDDKDEMEEITQLLEKYNCHPVFLKKEIKEKFFDGFCKGVLWPLLHYTMPQAKVDFAEKWDVNWQAYTGVNSVFAKEVTSVCEWQHDMVWIHNYHLFLLPSFLRKKLPRAKIGFFVHTPFPTSDVFRILPSRESILRGIMASDLVGFHTFDYARHFLSACKRILDLDFETLPGGQIGISYSGRDVSILISHVGIESHVFQAASRTPKVLQRRDAIRKQFAPRRIILGADDLDAVKGSITKLQGLSRFLEDNPEKRDKIVLVEIISGSSNSPAEQKSVRDSMMREIDSIRDKYGDEQIHVLERVPMDIDELVAWYLAAEVAVISTYWDGLNLTPYEYTASQHEENPGTLVLSEFMGCVRSLNGVTRVNPWALEKMSEAIAQCLDQSLEERQENHRRRFRYVMNHTTERWAAGFLTALDRATQLSDELSFVTVGFGSSVRLVGLRSDFSHLKEDALTGAYAKSEQRILIFDYDGTITTTAQKLPPPTDEVVNALRILSSDPRNTVFIISGRRRRQLGSWFHSLPQLGLAAEKGCYIRWPARLRSSRPALPSGRVKVTVSGHRTDSKSAAASAPGDEQMWDAEHWETLVPTDDFSWKAIALEIIKAYTENTDGSYIEDKESAIVWHYEAADPEYGRMQASELGKYLVKVIPSGVVDVVRYDYNRILEIKPKGIGKGITTSLVLEVATTFARAASSATATAAATATDSGAAAGLRLSKRAVSGGASAAAVPPFVMCVGDDRADEEMFEALQVSPLLLQSDATASDSKSAAAALFAPSPTAAGSYVSAAGSSAPLNPLQQHASASGSVRETASDSDSVSAAVVRSNRLLKAGTASRAVFQPSLFTTTVGIKPSAAHYYCNDSDEVIAMIEALAASSDSSLQRKPPKTQPLSPNSPPN